MAEGKEKPESSEPKEPLTTLCENCGADFPIEDSHSCEKCGNDPLCPSCVCEDCPAEEDEDV